jgi:adenine deaminase
VALRDHPKVLGLAEFMNFPGVISQGSGLYRQARRLPGWHIDGHAPLLRGMDLNGYLAAGIRTDHECTTAAEAREKLSKGMHDPDPRGLRLERPARAGADSHRAHGAVLRLLHR